MKLTILILLAGLVYLAIAHAVVKEAQAHDVQHVSYSLSTLKELAK